MNCEKMQSSCRKVTGPPCYKATVLPTALRAALFSKLLCLRKSGITKHSGVPTISFSNHVHRMDHHLFIYVWDGKVGYLRSAVTNQ